MKLGVIYIESPEAIFFEQHAQVGNVVEIRVGGEFIYDSEKEKTKDTCNLIFIAGGVGINPLISMIESIYEEGKYRHIERIQLLYSVRSRAELLFFERIEWLKKKFDGILECIYFLTREDPLNQNESRFIYQKRISKAVINDILKQDRLPYVKCFLCGPEKMENHIIELLQDAGLNYKQISFEKW